MLVDIKNARKEYGEGETLVRALDDISFSLEEGKLYVVLGASGSGKSTLMNMIGGLDSLSGGSISVGGEEITSLKGVKLTDYRRHYVGFVFQSYNLIPDLTARENIQAVADIAENPLDIDELMEALDIKALASRFPRELSGGQQQRVAIARAMVKNPKLLLCDELTGALDTKASRSVLELIERMNALYHTTIIIITHNQTIADMADGVLQIRDGKLVEFVENRNRKKAAELAL